MESTNTVRAEYFSEHFYHLLHQEFKKKKKDKKIFFDQIVDLAHIQQTEWAYGNMEKQL